MSATAHKIRNNREFVKVERNILCGNSQAVNNDIPSFKASKKINTALIKAGIIGS